MAVKMQLKMIYIYATFVSLLLIAAALFYCLVISDTCSMNTFFFTADQQGRRLYQQEKYEAAAKRFAGLQ